MAVHCTGREACTVSYYYTIPRVMLNYLKFPVCKRLVKVCYKLPLYKRLVKVCYKFDPIYRLLTFFCEYFSRF